MLNYSQVQFYLSMVSAKEFGPNVFAVSNYYKLRIGIIYLSIILLVLFFIKTIRYKNF